MPLMVTLTIDILTANDAVQDNPRAEVSRILNNLSRRLEDGEATDFFDEISIHDFNGNRIGTCLFEVEEEEE